MDKIRALLEEILNADLEKLVLSAARNKSVPYKRITMRPVALHGDLAFQIELASEKKVLHENVDKDRAIALSLEYISDWFKQINSISPFEEVQVLAAKPDNPRIIRKSTGKRTASGPGNNANNANSGKIDPRKVLAHNRAKNYIIPDGVPCDFLIELGVMDSAGMVFKKSYAKFRQINRYLEIVADSLKSLGAAAGSGVTAAVAGESSPFRVIDFGCGKAYLTFALYWYLKIRRGMDVEVIGLDLKEDVIEFCGGVAKKLGYDGLTFMHGDIADFESDGADMVVTLHACDTATDYALSNAVKWGSRIILSVPCCQHELFRQIKNPLMQPMLRHGILNERFTEILTDGLRGLRLESRGYDVDMIEFTSLEHTARNIMIKAIRRGAGAACGADGVQNARDFRAKKAAAQYDALCAEFNVRPTTSII